MRIFSFLCFRMRCATVAVLLILPLLVSAYYVKVGILSDDPDTAKSIKVWSMAQNYSTMMSLEPVVTVTQWWSILDAPAFARTICRLAQMGVDALVYLGPPQWNHLVSSYSNQLGLPFISAVDNGREIGKHQINMVPDTSRAAAEFIKHFEWNRFTFLYDSQHGPIQLQNVLQTLLTHNFVPRVETFWRAPDADQAIRYIHELLDLNPNKRIVLATSEEFADQFVAKVARARNYNVLLLTAVGTVQKASNQGFYKLTKLSVVEAGDPLLKTLENRLKTIPSHPARGTTKKDIPDSIILQYDSSSTLNTMFNKIARESPEGLKSRKNSDCLGLLGDVPQTANYLRQVVVEHGATGRIEFDEIGCRTGYKINIMQTTPFDVQKVGTWSESTGLKVTPEFSKVSFPAYAAYRTDPPLRVTSFEVAPFLYVSANNKFSGYVIDLMDALSDEIGRDYQLHIVKDGRFGTFTDGKWNGMVGELVRGEADLAVCSLTKTPIRETAVDFSKNIMTAGLNILVKKQKSEMNTAAFGPFTFLTIWSPETWIVILVAIAIYSTAGYFISRFIGSPDRVRALETRGTDNLSPCGSVWFTIGSLFCRDTGIYPRNVTHRLWALLWWIFCIFISLLYVSMLTSALIKSRNTVTTIQSRKTSQEVLKDLLDTGVPAIGVLRSGSTSRFFLNSEIGLYQQFGRYLQENPQVFAKSYKEGLERVKKSDGKYAFIMESSTSHFLANTPPCDTLTTSGFLNTMSFAVAMQKNSTLKEVIDHGILTLMERGVIRELYEKWWYKNSTSCEDPNLDMLPKIYSRSMTLYEVSGVFYLLIALAFVSMASAAVEYYVKTRNSRME